MLRDETPARRVERIKGYWPGIEFTDVLWIEPLGSRHDALVFWRAGGRVATGVGSYQQGACFEGSLDEFEAKVRKDYDARIAIASQASYVANLRRLRADYLAAAAFFRSLMAEEANP